MLVSLLSDIAEICSDLTARPGSQQIRYSGSRRYNLSWVVIEIGFDEQSLWMTCELMMGIAEGG